MDLLLDSSALIYAVGDPRRLAPSARAAIETPGNSLLVCAITGFEISVAIARGRLQVAESPAEWLERARRRLSLDVLDIDLDIAVQAALLPRHHLDGFDRLIIATARRHRVPLVTDDREIAKYDVDIVW